MSFSGWPAWASVAVLSAVAWTWLYRCSMRDRASAALQLRTYHEKVQRELRRYRYAEWWARNAAEEHGSRLVRRALQEFALYALASDSMDELRAGLTRQNALGIQKRVDVTGPDGAVASFIWASDRDSLVNGAATECPVIMDAASKAPYELDPWDKWARECPGRPRHNAGALHEYRGLLLSGGELVRDVEYLQKAARLLERLQAAGVNVDVGGAPPGQALPGSDGSESNSPPAAPPHAKA